MINRIFSTAAALSLLVTSGIAASEDFDLRDVDTIVGYFVSSPPTKSKGMLLYGDVIHLRPTDHLYVAIHVERDRAVAYSMLGKLTRNLDETYISAQLPDGAIMYLTRNKTNGFDIAVTGNTYEKGDGSANGSGSSGTGGN